MAKQVLILGGGYAGAYAALGAARARGDEVAEIAMVSAEPDLVNRPRLYEPGPGAHIRYPLAPMLDRIGVGFRVARVTGMNEEVEALSHLRAPALLVPILAPQEIVSGQASFNTFPVGLLESFAVA
jgi:2-polyprenyl-6-methoxyphenol hydroxylase-like FAD-dependent oxidoreductase